MLYIGYLIIVNGQNVKEIGVEKCHVSATEGGKPLNKLCPSPLPPFKRPKRPNGMKNTERGHSSFSVHWYMYKRRGAGRWA